MDADFAIPGYELIARLGGGPMTVVYRGREIASDTPCVIKLIRPEWDDQPTAVKLLQREARAALAVAHPRLVRLRHAEVTCPPCFLILDFLAGESLGQRLRRERRLPLADALWIARQITEPLAALHRAGFLHSDLKPDNVMLSPEGEATLIDLGFAHRPGENSAFLRKGYLLGTANYLAPELCGSWPADDFAGDLFSLGVMLFEMLTGRLPYPPGSLRQTMRRHACDPPAKLRQYAGDLPRALTVLVERLLSREPEHRPRASAVIHQLIKLEIESLRYAKRA